MKLKNGEISSVTYPECLVYISICEIYILQKYYRIVYSEFWMLVTMVTKRTRLPHFCVC